MKKPVSALVSLFLLAAFALAPAPAAAWPFGGEKARLLEKADAEYEAAKAAGQRFEVVTQLTELRKALGSYRQLSAQYPDYEKERVAGRMREVAFTLGSIEEKVRRGEIALPAEDLAAASQPVGGVSAEAVDGKKPTDPDVPAYRRPIPQLVRMGETPPAAGDAPAAPAAPPADPVWLSEGIPNPLAAGAPAPARPFSPLPEAGAPAAGPAPEDPARLARFANMIRAERAPAAVMELEDLLEKEGPAASVGTRAMFVRALLACGNYERAADEAKSIPASADADPAVRLLRVAVAVSRDNLMEAQRQLDRLVTEHPDYSDAYVDFAYVTFLSDPRNPEMREMAVIYYKTALQRGAKRDSRLEEELGIRVE